jgi:hypothetical protein
MPVFGLVVLMDLTTGLLALFALKPLRQRLLPGTHGMAAA